MRVRVAAGFLLVAALVALTLTCTYGWGENAERLIANKAVDTLPQEMSPFFQANRQYLVQHVADAGELDAKIAADEHKDYIELDHYGPYPYNALPRIYTAAVAKYGRRALDNYGLLPWQIGLYSKKLTDAFRGTTGPTQRFPRPLSHTMWRPRTTRLMRRSTRTESFRANRE